MPRRRWRDFWMFIAGMCLGSTVLFVAFGGLSHGFSPRSVTALALSGAGFGAIAAPEVSPEAFHRPALWQTACGAVGAVALAAALGADARGLVGAAVVGGVLGFFAPAWVKHVDIP